MALAGSFYFRGLRCPKLASLSSDSPFLNFLSVSHNELIYRNVWRQISNFLAIFIDETSVGTLSQKLNVLELHAHNVGSRMDYCYGNDTVVF